MRTLREFSIALTQAQKAQKVTAVALAERTGLTPLSVRQILAGVTAPRLTNAMALAEELGFEIVLMPKAAAQSLSQPQQATRSVLSDVERRLHHSGPTSSAPKK